jgi:Protein of unknown function (DUF1573)
MKKSLVFIGLVTAAALFAGILSAQESKGPKIAITEIKYDFGKVVQGTVASHVFEIRNVGNETLIIDRVAPS